jgi:hypothetical protein
MVKKPLQKPFYKKIWHIRLIINLKLDVNKPLSIILLNLKIVDYIY